MNKGIIIITLLFIAIAFVSCVHTENKEEIFFEKKHQTMRVLDRYLYTAYDEKVILRGINRLIIWVDKDGWPSLTEMA